MKKLNIFEAKTTPSGCSKIAKSRPYLVSIFQEKYDYFLSYFVLFLLKKGAWLKIKRLESKSDLPYFSLTILGHNPVQTVSSQHVLILSLLVTEVVFFFKFQTTFSGLPVFLGTTPTFFEK